MYKQKVNYLLKNKSEKILIYWVGFKLIAFLNIKKIDLELLTNCTFQLS